MKQQDIDILPDKSIVLVLHDGSLPHGMSTIEAKRFAVKEFFGSLITEMKRLENMTDKETALSQAVLQIREFLEVR